MNQIQSTIISGLLSRIDTKTTSASTMDTVDTSDGEESNLEHEETGAVTTDEEEEAANDSAADLLLESSEIATDENRQLAAESRDHTNTATQAAKDEEQLDEQLPIGEEELATGEAEITVEENLIVTPEESKESNGRSDDTHGNMEEETLQLSTTEEVKESVTTEAFIEDETVREKDGGEKNLSEVVNDSADGVVQAEDQLSKEKELESASPVPLLSPNGPIVLASASSTTSLAVTKTFTAQHRIPSRAAIKVIKGEIHNVLTVLRDQRYVSRSRFTQEIVEDDEDLTSTSHPVVQALQDLHTQVTAAAELVAMQPDLVIDVDYLEPFCQCIELPEISAIVTGKALGSLHKFVLYGFVSPSLASISYQDNREPLGAVMRIAEALLNCSFEETATGVLTNNNHQIDADGSESNGASNHPGLRPVGNRSLAHLRRRKTAGKDDLLFDDEQTILQLLDVAALVVRTSMQDDSVHLVQASTISRLLDTCLHVSHRADNATPLLKSAASSALSQIVLQVFAAPGYEPVMQARKEVMEKLAALLNPKQTEMSSTNGDAASTPGKKAKADPKQRQINHLVATNGLTLVNIALEACREPLTREEVQILQNDVCRYLLQWSHSSHDLSLLSLTLRVIFNLFQSIRNELKVPLEVFLTSIHMRIINDDACVRHSPEEREVALESLVEFCQEPDMVQDIYLNYDCDVACSNLYEAIVTALGKAATPVGWEEDGNVSDESNGDYTENEDVEMASKHSAHNPSEESANANKLSKKPSATESVLASFRDPAVSNHVSPVTHLHRLSMEGLLSVLESIAKRCTGKSAAFRESSRSDSGISEADSSRSWDPSDASQITTEELHERKRRKHALVKIARVFNSSSSSSEWLDIATKEGVVESKESVEGVAEVLFTASMLDKAKVGLYLSKGPDDAYPFNAAVRQAFVERYDFSDLTFAAALRKFLSKFRLPGEAQCIDRIMESFSKELYRQQGETSFFKSADAVFVLAFSTIMLNTDLHNPMIKQENRMTLEQFIKNNRGINDGEDLPEDFLVKLYEQIKSKQIEVRSELGDIIKQHGEQEDFRKVWDNMISKKGEVALPFFSQAGVSRSTSQVAGFHHKEMFIGLAKPAIQAFAGIFQRSWDDSLVVKALGGLRTMCRVAAYFECGSILDDVLNILIPMGTEYVMNTTVMDSSGSDTVKVSQPGNDGDDDFNNSHGRPIPYGLLCSYRGKEEIDITGSAHHRGLLALDCGFGIVRKYTARVVSAWPAYIECICALRDARALPGGMTDLDDFADSNGNVLPQSTFARTSQRRLNEVYRAHSEEEKAAKNKGWLRSIFRRNSKDTDELEDRFGLQGKGNKLSKVAKVLLDVAEAADVEAIVHLSSGQTDVKRKIQLQIDCLDNFPFKHDPVGEQHAIFSIELATRALLSNRDHALEWFIPFLNKFEVVLSAVTSTKVPAPFVIERIVVTILRCCIHLYDIEETRGQLKASLHLVMMSLPKNFIKVIADRMACGLAIVLRNSYFLFATPNDWTFLGDTMDTLAHFSNSRVFVFDGIASTVEFALMQVDSQESSSVEEHPALTMDAALEFTKILIRFVLAFYQGDISFGVPALLCLEKVYRHVVELELKQNDTKDVTDVTKAAPNEELFQNMAVAIYTVCRAADVELSSEGAKCFRRVVIRTDINQIADEKWVDIMYLMANKQPPVTADASRGNTFSLLGQLASHVLPHLSHDKDIREDLVDIIQQFAQLARENLRQGRRGKVSPLFDKTLQTVTYLSNLMVTEEWKGDTEFSLWASEILLSELERVGAAGASVHNQKATKPKPGPISSNASDAQVSSPASVVQISPSQKTTKPKPAPTSINTSGAQVFSPPSIVQKSPTQTARASLSLNNGMRGSPLARGGGRVPPPNLRNAPPPNYKGPGGPPPHLRGGPGRGREGGRGVSPLNAGRGAPPLPGRGVHPPNAGRSAPPPNARVIPSPSIPNNLEPVAIAVSQLSESEKIQVEAS